MSKDIYELICFAIVCGTLLGMVMTLASCEKQHQVGHTELVESNAFLRGLMEGSK